MLKVQSRADLHMLTHEPAKMAVPDAPKQPAPDFSAAIKQLTESVQATAKLSTQAIESIHNLAQAMAERTNQLEAAMKKPKSKTFVAEVERDHKDRMKRVIIKAV